MTLILSVLRCPDRVTPETRSVAGGEFAIGRGPDNDWVLPDPDRVLSKRHCMLAFRSGFWQVADLSANGTFLNRGAHPIGQGQVQDIRDGDRLRFGAYEIEVRIGPETMASVTMASVTMASAGPGRAADPFAPLNPFHEDPFAAPPPARPGSFGYDPLAADQPGEVFAGPTQPDHSQPGQDAFIPPRLASAVLPDDWDLDGLAPPAGPPAVAEPEAVAEPLAQPAPPPSAPEDSGLLLAFLEGAGLADARPADPRATMAALGRAFRALVAGLRQALIARAAIKGEFRIEQTMIRSKGNNPLKFSAGDDDALAALLGVGRRVDMGPAEAVADALRDMRLHELASVAAMQTAVRALLAQLDPAALRRAADQGGGLTLVPAQRKARAWDAFEALHSRTSQALADDFDSVFGRAFARAYEQSLREAMARGEDR